MPRAPSPRSLRRPTTSTRLLGLFLGATVVLSCWLAVHAVLSTRSHRETAKAVLRDYAGVAASEYARVGTQDLSRMLAVVFDDVPRRSRPGRLPGLDDVARELDDAGRALRCACEELRRPQSVFRYLVAERSLDSWPPGTPADESRALAASLEGRAETTSHERRGLWIGGPTDPEALLAWGAVRGEDADWAAFYGVHTSTGLLTELAAGWYRRGALFPDAIAAGVPNDSLVAITVRQPNGRTIYSSAPHASGAFRATDTFPAHLGSLVIEASIAPQAAGSLVIGGLPGSRLPTTLALLGLTLTVAAAGLWEVRRHHELSQIRENFISSVSHELRTPLTQIRMLAELQEDGKLRGPEERARANAVIRREAQRLTQLVENILQFSRLRAIPPQPATRGVPLREAVDEALATLAPLATQADVHIEARVDEGTVAAGSREGVRRILLNLLDNALKYGPPGQTVRVTARSSSDRVTLVVEDQGPGIPANDRAIVWEPYRRLDRDIDARRPGTGMGLAVVRELATRMGGSARAEAAAGGGARLVVELASAEGAVGGPAEATDGGAGSRAGADGAAARAGADGATAITPSPRAPGPREPT